MPTTLHPEYLSSLPDWLMARDILAGERRIKAAGEKYLTRLTDQSDDEYEAYRRRATFFNATARTAEGYLGLVYRRPPTIRLPTKMPPSAAPWPCSNRTPTCAAQRWRCMPSTSSAKSSPSAAAAPLSILPAKTKIAPTS